MKIRLLATVIMVLSEQSLAQGYYPLQTGNVWQYYETPPPGQYYGWTARATEDTLMPNGQRFRIIPTDLVYSDTTFLRQSGSKVYAWERIPLGGGACEEILLCDFDKRRGDTVEVRYYNGFYTYSIVVEFYPSNFFGRLLNTWTVVTERRPNPFQTMRQFMDSVGLVYIEYEGGMSYFMRGCIINGVQYGIITGVQESCPAIVNNFRLLQNFPNPFNPATRIRYDLPEGGFVSLSVFDVLGRKIVDLVNEHREAGYHSVTWNGAGQASGVYIARLAVSNEFGKSQCTMLSKLVLIK